MKLNSTVRDHIPLEQGLRLVIRLLFVTHCLVRDHIPLEQGLRHRSPCDTGEPVTSETIFH